MILCKFWWSDVFYYYLRGFFYRDDIFVGKLDLGVGEYQYKYIVDDKWLTNKNQVNTFADLGWTSS